MSRTWMARGQNAPHLTHLTLQNSRLYELYGDVMVMAASVSDPNTIEA